MIALKNVLVATDFGDASDAALTYGRELARSCGATLHLLHVTDDLVTHYPIGIYPVLYPEVQGDVNVRAKEQLERLLTDDDRARLRARAVVRTSNLTASAIVSYADEARIDLIVMGTHGRGAVSRFFVGSVAEGVMRTAPCPVLTVHHPEREFVVPDTLAVAASA